MRGRVGAALAVLWVLAGGAAAQEGGGPPDVPTGPGTVRGRVLHAETELPVPDVDVVLWGLSPSGEPGMRRTRSDAEGCFAFPGVATTSGHTYLVGVRYRGIPHPGGRAVFSEGAEEIEVDVRVHETTADPSGLVVPQALLRVHGIGGKIVVSETLRFENTGTRTIHVDEDDRPGARPALRTRLPEGAADFHTPLGVVPEGVEFDEARGELTYWGPIHPGPSNLGFIYSVPAQGEETVFRAPLPAATESVEVLVPKAGPAVRVAALSEEAERRIDGRDYRVFAGPAPEGGLELALSLPPARLDSAAFEAVEARLLLRVDDAALDVSESHSFRVEGETPVSGGEEPLTWIPLPAEATGLRFGSSAPGLTLRPDPRGGLAIVGVAPPGEATVEIGYRLPVMGADPELVRSFGHRVPLLSIFVPDTGQQVPESSRLHRRRPVATSDLTYTHLEGFEIEPGEEVRLRIASLPPRRSLGSRASAGLLALMAVGAIAVLAAPLRQARAAEGGEEEPVESAAARERRFLYTAIQDLDDDYETGKISAEDHRALREDLRARAVALLRAEREESAKSPAEPARAADPGRTCPSCAAALRPDDRFCAQCGKALSPPVGREAEG